MHQEGDSRYIVTALGVVVFISVCVTIPTMVASQAMYLVNQAYTNSSQECTGTASYSVIYKVDTCHSHSKYSCLNSTHYSVNIYKSDVDCGEVDGIISSSSLTLLGCQENGGEMNTNTECIENSLPQPPSNSYIYTRYSSKNCLPDTEIYIEQYPLNTCFRISANSWAKYSCNNGAVNIRSNCNDSQCIVCDDVSMENLEQCTDGTKHICIKGCDLEARQRCDSVFTQCNLQSSACDCYQAWGQCVFDSGCDQDATAEKSCREFCNNDSCKCNFANPCTDDSFSNSLLANLALMGGSILIYFFLSL